MRLSQQAEAEQGGGALAYLQTARYKAALSLAGGW